MKLDMETIQRVNRICAEKCLCSRSLCRFEQGCDEVRKIEDSVKVCGKCGYLDTATMYLSKPPKYKCEYLGCLVTPDDVCRRKYAEK